MIDSVFNLDSSLDFDVGMRRDLLNKHNEDDTTGHGTIVCQILNSLSDRLELNLYRVTQKTEDGGKIWERHLINAFGYAHLRDNVDIINLSAGNDHSEDGNEGCARHNQPCKVRDAAKQAIEDGIPVVAAAGNSDQYSSVCCPSLLDRAISVGGFVSKCTAGTPEFQVNNIDMKPPLACWTYNDEESYAFCSGEGCFPVPKYSCTECNSVVNWSGNVDPVWNKPDILAPAAEVIFGNEPQIVPATSWSTPWVTSMSAEIMAAARDRGKEVPPYLLRQGMENTAKKLDSGEEKLFNADGTLHYIFGELDLPRPTPEETPSFHPTVGL